MAWHNIVLAMVAITLTGCVILPPGDASQSQGQHIEKSSTLFLDIGKTKRLDVVERLGTPDVIWETERIHIYRSERVVGRVIWALPVGPYSATTGITDARERRVLLIRFDTNDRVQRFDLLEQGFFESLGTIMRRWHSAEQAIPQNSSTDRQIKSKQ